MTPNELRIGNWVLWGELMVKLGALGIMEFDVGAIKYEPVPLTPEILEKCGFIGEPDWEIAFATLTIKENMFLVSYSDNEYGFRDWDAVELKYLHQLQNLYFALTGEELQIEL